MMSHGDLVAACVAALDCYDANNQAQDVYIQEFLENANIHDDSDQTFITEVFSGCVRYSQILRVVMDGFFARDGKTILRSEEHLYRVVAYLSLFRLDELGTAHFRKFVQTQDRTRMYQFMNFFFNEKNLRTWIKDEWLKLYDQSFVQTTLMSPLLRWLPELREMVDGMKHHIDNKVKMKKKEVKSTEIKPFNLTQPRPRSIPIPEPIPRLHKSQPPPRTTFTEPREMTDLTKKRELNRRKAEATLVEASKKQFSCANPEKSSKTKERLQNIIGEKESKLEFNKHRSKPIPKEILENEIPIKLNTAAILREGRLYKKRERQELDKLEKLQAGARDPSDFLEWQSKMRQQDLDEQIAEIERRRIEGQLSHEEAILARQNLIQDNKAKVAEMKQEAAEMMAEYVKQKLEEEKEMKVLVETVLEGRENAKDAKKKLQDYKSKIVQEVNEESRELMKRALEEAEAEMREKMALIQQIRAMEATPVIRHKFVDLTQTAGHGLLNEMSIAELKERMALLKIAEREEEDDKRDEILSAKQAKDQILLDTLQTISRHRQEQSKVMAQKLEQRKAPTQKPVVKDDKLRALQEKLEQKRAQRLQEQQRNTSADRKATQKLRQLSAEKKQREQDRWKELEESKERTARLLSKGIGSSATATRLATGNSALLAL